jgi:hypothetical protein
MKQSVDIRIIQGFDGGKTLGVSLPKSWMNDYRITKGDRVKLRKQKDHIILEKLEL